MGPDPVAGARRPRIASLLPSATEIVGALGLADQLAWRGLPAVRAGAVWAVDANSYVSRSGPRLVDGVELLHELLARRPDEVEGRARRIAASGAS
jgi:ABC-type Fe3+-hydroxamate transport system substrate-binding protein